MTLLMFGNGVSGKQGQQQHTTLLIHLGAEFTTSAHDPSNSHHQPLPSPSSLVYAWPQVPVTGIGLRICWGHQVMSTSLKNTNVLQWCLWYYLLGSVQYSLATSASAYGTPFDACLSKCLRWGTTTSIGQQPDRGTPES